MSFAHLHSAEATDVGKKRRNNEDAVLRLPGSGVFCVADGMGGFEHGEMASGAIIDALEEALSGRHIPGNAAAPGLDQTVHLINEAALNANHLIREYCDQQNISGSGSTIVVLAFDPNNPRRAKVLHAGDSRAYRLRGLALDRLTKDHSLAAAAGVEDTRQLNRMFSAMITRAVGINKDISLETSTVDVEQGDLFMLCSDGLTSVIDSTALQEILAQNRESAIESLAQILIDAANEAGGPDNISVVLIRVGALPVSATPPEADTAEREGAAASSSDEDLTPDEAHTDEPPAVQLPDTDEPRRFDSDQPLPTSDLECVTPSVGSTPDAEPQPAIEPRSAISGPEYPRSQGRTKLLTALAVAIALAAMVVILVWSPFRRSGGHTDNSLPVDKEVLPDAEMEALIARTLNDDLSQPDTQLADIPETGPLLSQTEIENMRKMLPTKIEATLLTGEWSHL
ncbi:MAG: serine/threonine-protein phosphatase, partial [Lentisphaerales bacterium]